MEECLIAGVIPAEVLEELVSHVHYLPHVIIISLKWVNSIRKVNLVHSIEGSSQEMNAKSGE